MDSREFKKAPFYTKSPQNNNYPEYKRYPLKRKYEDEEAAPANKRAFYSQKTYTCKESESTTDLFFPRGPHNSQPGSSRDEEAAPANKQAFYSQKTYACKESEATTDPFFPRGPHNSQPGSSRDEASAQKEPPKRFSANDRLKKIRKTVEEQVKAQTSSAQIPLLDFNSSGNAQLSYSPNEANKRQTVHKEHEPRSRTDFRNRQTRFLPSKPRETQNVKVQVEVPTESSDKSTFVVTAKPSTLEERIASIRNSITEPARSSTPQSSTVSSGYSENKSEHRRLQEKLVDYDEREHIRLQKIFTASPPNTVTENNVQTCTPPYTNTISSYPASPNSRGNTQDIYMDWSYIEERKILSNLQEWRKDGVVAHEIAPQTPFQETVAKESIEIPQNETILQDIYVVVDTNIFLSHLNTVKVLLDIKVNVAGVVSPIILVPWMVIQELDYIKDGRSENNLKNKAQKAISFINDHLLCKNSRVKGQSVRDAARQDFAGRSADDGILYCCLQILERHNRPMLLSNDVNLRNKAMINGVDSYTHNDIIHALDPFRNDRKPSNSNAIAIKELTASLSKLLCEVIPVYLEDAYGLVWPKVCTPYKSLPWSLEYCLQLLQKYWQSVFSMCLQKHCMAKFNKLSQLLEQQSKTVTTSSKSVEDFFVLCLDVCVFLKNDLGNFDAQIDECINHIQAVGDTLTKP